MEVSKIEGIPTTMQIGVIPRPHEVEFREVDIPELRPGEVLVRQRAAAICSWEYRTYSGHQDNKFPFLGGHEIAGEVVALCGDCGEIQLGDRVSIGPTPCGTCHWCRSGAERACKSAVHFVSFADAWGPGGFAEYRVMPARGVFSIGDAPFELGSLSEPLSCALHGVRMLGVEPGDDAIVLGAGVMGLFNIAALKLRGARVTVTEIDASRLELARTLGADNLVDASVDDPVAAVMALTGGRGAQHVIPAIGGPSAAGDGWRMLSERGRLLVFASSHPDFNIEFSSSLAHNTERGAFGTIRMDVRDFYAASRLIGNGQLNLEPLVAKTFPFADLKAALEAASVPNTYRSVVTF